VSNFIFLTPKRPEARTTYNNVLRVGVSKGATRGRGEETKKGQKLFLRQTGYLLRPPTSM